MRKNKESPVAISSPTNEKITVSVVASKLKVLSTGFEAGGTKFVGYFTHSHVF